MTLLDIGHHWHSEPHPDIPQGLNGEVLCGWECSTCTLFVMVPEGQRPEEAARVYVSCGSFTPNLWHHWTCAAYITHPPRIFHSP